MRKGDKGEKKFSIEIHHTHCPVLVSSLLLRSFNAGQVDLAGLLKIHNEWNLFIYEVKSTRYPGCVQYRRLLRTQDYLSRVLGMPVKLEVKFCQKDEPYLFF